MGWMAHRKWKEIKEQPSILPGPAVPGSCLASFHFLWVIHPIRPVVFSSNILTRNRWFSVFALHSYIQQGWLVGYSSLNVAVRIRYIFRERAGVAFNLF